MKIGLDALDTAENESGSAKHEKSMPSTPPKMSSGAQNMKIGPDALRTAENDFGHAKH
jgi:hypothetical protein